jgi:hypothetical protein
MAMRSAVLLSVQRRVSFAIAAAAFLAAGYWLKPVDLSLPQAEEPPAPLLQQTVEQREARTVFRALQDAAASTVRFAARLDVPAPPRTAWSDWDRTVPVPRPQLRYGVVVGPHDLLANVADAPPDAVLRIHLGDGRAVAGRVTSRGPVPPLARRRPALVMRSWPSHPGRRGRSWRRCFSRPSVPPAAPRPRR